MQFQDNQPIWLQIYDYVCRAVLSGKWPEEERIPSVRELAATLQVNPNTVMRAYERLESARIIANRRGIGFFVESGARMLTLTAQRQEFLRDTLPSLFRRMEELNIDLAEIQRLYALYRQTKNHENKQ